MTRPKLKPLPALKAKINEDFERLGKQYAKELEAIVRKLIRELPFTVTSIIMRDETWRLAGARTIVTNRRGETCTMSLPDLVDYFQLSAGGKEFKKLCPYELDESQLQKFGELVDLLNWWFEHPWLPTSDITI